MKLLVVSAVIVLNALPLFAQNCLTDIILNTSVTNSYCNNSNGTASVAPVGGVPPYTYKWSNGDTLPVADNLPAGNYVITVTDAGGCSNFKMVTINDSNGPQITVDSIIPVSCFNGSDCAVDITVSGGTSPYYYEWSNGAFTADVSNLPYGPHDVTVTDMSGCKAGKSVFVTQPEKINSNVTTIKATCGISNGSASISVTGGTSPYTFTWPGGGNDTIKAGLSAGAYSVNITDKNNCTDSVLVLISEQGGPQATVDSIINASCGKSNGAVYMSVAGGTGTYSYSWSSGASTEDITGIGTGQYILTVTDGLGCKGLNAGTVTSVVTAPSICMVTVDSVFASNQVVWEKLPGTNILSYNIYRESMQPGVYFLVRNVPYDSLSVFTDYSSNPYLSSCRYRLSAIDSCGNESAKSAPHRSIHLVVNPLNNSVKLNWNHYQGFTFDTYTILRYNASTGWVVIDSVASTVNAYEDANPIPGTLNYSIEALYPDGCSATRAKNYNSSRSNRSQSIASPADAGPGTLVNENNATGFLAVYPNPTNALLNIELELTGQEAATLLMYDVQGKLVLNTTFNVAGRTTRQVDMMQYGAGVYYMQVITNNGTINKKVVVN